MGAGQTRKCLKRQGCAQHHYLDSILTEVGDRTNDFLEVWLNLSLKAVFSFRYGNVYFHPADLVI